MRINVYLGLGLTDFLIICGTSLGVLLGITLFFVKSRNLWSNRLLALLVWAILLYMIPGFADRFDQLQELPHIIGLQRLSGYLIGPLIFFYVRSSLIDGYTINKLDLLHLLPAAFDLLYNIPFFLQSGTLKLEQHATNLQGLTFTIPALLKSLHAFIYLLLSIKLIDVYRKHLRNTVSNIDKDYHQLMTAITALLIVPLGAILIYAVSGFTISMGLVILTGFFLFFVGLMIISLVKPRLLHDFPNPMEAGASTQKKYTTSNLQEEQKQKYLARLTQYMQDHQPHLQSELTISQLASELNLLPNHLSQVINEKLNKSFLDFINQHRVEVAKQLLADPKKRHLTVLAIAHDSGFNSKTAFYSAFKKQIGSNPSEFRKSLNINE